MSQMSTQSSTVVLILQNVLHEQEKTKNIEVNIRNQNLTTDKSSDKLYQINSD